MIANYSRDYILLGMPKSGQLIRQILCLAFYTVFFAVQLHYKYIYSSPAPDNSKMKVASADAAPGQKSYNKTSTKLQLRVNVKLNKRYFPSEPDGISPSSLAKEDQLIPVKHIMLYVSPKLMSESILSRLDRGPPTTHQLVFA